MEQAVIIKGFTQLGALMRSIGGNEEWSDFSLGITSDEYEEIQNLVIHERNNNPWFTEENVRKNILAIGVMLQEESLRNWVSGYEYTLNPKRVAVIMAGNIPMVGFHDFMSVLLSGNAIIAKLSSDDKNLLPVFAKHLVEFVPGLNDRISFTEGRINEMDAVIATGSDNSLKYFEQYFGKYPHIFRKNRTSLAVLTGDESKEELIRLGADIFTYFGLGCRNVTHLMMPEGFDLNRFFEAIVDYGDVIHHHKYANNYDYNKAIYLMNKHELLDNNFVLLKESEDLFSPLAMINYHYYTNKEEVNEYIRSHEDSIQCIVGKEFTPFGEAQCPALDDYADGVDTMNWLQKLT